MTGFTTAGTITTTECQECARLRESHARLLEALKAVESLARVNAPIYDGSTAYKGIVAVIARAEQP